MSGVQTVVLTLCFGTEIEIRQVMASRWAVTRGWVATVACLAAAVVGCSRSDRAKVSGTLIRQDGSPLVGARVIASSPDLGKTAQGQSDNDGKFKLGVSEEADGVPPGSYAIAILESRGDSETRPPATIAKKYQSPSTSGLNLTVEAGESKQLELTLDAPVSKTR